MNIGIIGSGEVGQTLAKGFLKYGYPVMIGSRSPSKLEDWSKRKGMGAAIGTFDQASEFGELLVLGVKGQVAKEVLEELKSERIQDKIVIDVTNPIDETKTPDNGVLHFTTSLESSFMEEVQNGFPSVRFVKAFNSVSSAYMVDPPFESKPTMFICGNDNTAKEVVVGILEKFGWEAEDMGGVESARAIEPLSMLLCIPGILRNDWSHAYKLLRPSSKP